MTSFNLVAGAVFVTAGLVTPSLGFASIKDGYVMTMPSPNTAAAITADDAGFEVAKRGRGRGRGGDRDRDNDRGGRDDRRDDSKGSKGSGRDRPRIPGGSGCDDPEDLIEHPECRA